MDPAERRRIALAVVGAMLAVFCLALLLMFLDGALFNTGIDSRGETSGPAKIGIDKAFYVYDYSLEKRVKVNMTCAAIGGHSIIYKEDSVKTSPALLNRITTEFDEDIYPANRSHLLGKTIMGLVKEDKVVILLLNEKRGRPADPKQKVVSGYYSQDNEQLKLYKSDSNEARIINIFVGRLNVTGDKVMETVAHETQHLRNWDIQKNNVGLIIGSLFAFATVMTFYLVLSNLYLRSFT